MIWRRDAAPRTAWGRARAPLALALLALACAVSPMLREMVGGRPAQGSAAMSLLSFGLACVALALGVRSSIDHVRARGRDGARPGRRGGGR